MVRRRNCGPRTTTSVYALAFDSKGRLLAGTGNRGHIFAINGLDDFSDLLKKLPASARRLTAFAKSPGGGLYAATSNLGKLFVLGPGPESEGTYESDVFDARIFSRWGRACRVSRGGQRRSLCSQRQRGQSRSQLECMEQNRPRRKPEKSGIPAARYAQWKALLHAGSAAPRVDNVALNYLPKKNVKDQFITRTTWMKMRTRSPMDLYLDSAISEDDLRDVEAEVFGCVRFVSALSCVRRTGTSSAGLHCRWVRGRDHASGEVRNLFRASDTQAKPEGLRSVGLQ